MSQPTVDNILAGAEKAITLNNGSRFARKVSLPTDWTVARLGIRYGFQGTANVSNSDVFALGLCSGTSDIYGDATPTHFLGVSVTDWSLNYHGAPDFYYGPLTFKARRIIAGTATDSAALAADCTVAANCATVDRYVCHFVDIVRGSPNYSVSLFYNQGTPVVSSATWFDRMICRFPVIAGHAYVGPQALAIDEGTDGVFDSVNVFWSASAASLLIADLGVVTFNI